MKLKIHSLTSFKKNIKALYKKHRNILKDIKLLENTLLNNPKAGILLSDNCYKIRVRNSSIPTGKSGGFRVIYYYLENSNLYFLAIYSKSDMENISDGKIKQIIKNNNLK